MTARFQSCRGFGLVESMVVVGIMAMGLLIAMPFAGTMIRRAEGVGAINTIRAMLASARIQAIKTGANVVVVISRSSNNGIHLETFRDKADLASPFANANDGNCLQEPGEPSLNLVDIDTHVHLWKYGGTMDDLATSAAFDGYVVNGAVNAGLTNRIVFLPTGGIAAPQNSNSGSPQATAPFGRGIYFADVTGKNYFRVTVTNTVASGTRVDKYVPGKGYVSDTWAWQ